MKKIVISTGGSGGHVIPALALYDHLNDKFNLSLITDKRGSKYIDKEKYLYSVIDVPNLFTNIFKLPVNLILFFYSIFKTSVYLKKNNIDILISTGGYMSLPFCISAKILNVNTFLFEPNMVIGRTNKFILRFSKKIICYESEIIGLPEKYKKKIFLIKPLLQKYLYSLNKKISQKISDPIKILVLGGSQGAEIFDLKIKNIIIELSKSYKIDITQQIYNDKIMSELKSTYKEIYIKNELFKFKKELFKENYDFDLAITRCGASAISELSYLGIPFIAIPFPYAKDNHQFYNAKYYFDKNCCWIINQKDFGVEKSLIFIENLIQNKEDYNNKKENLIKISYQNTWNNINQKLLEVINEN